MFIPNTNKRYSIFKDGNVYSNYRYTNNGKKLYKKVLLKKYRQLKNSNSTVISLWQESEKKPKIIHLMTLLKTCFNLKPPDNFHLYELKPKDGDYYNTSLKNLVFRIKVDSDSNYKFYPQPIYKKGKITHKICAICGKKKDISYFSLLIPKKETHNKTYRNRCKRCGYLRQYNSIKADEKRYLKYKQLFKEWQNSEIGQKYYKQYHKDRYKYDKENITPHYIGSKLRLYKDKLSYKDLPIKFIDLYKKTILLQRKIKSLNN